MNQKLDEATYLYRNTGQVTEKEMTIDLALPDTTENGRNSLPKDERVLYQQRAVMMNTAAVVQRYRARKEMK
jgi:hypothetical protein